MSTKNIALAALTLLSLLTVSCSKTEAKAPAGPSGVEPKKMADALFSVMKGTRTAYTRHIIARLKKTKIIKPNEKWEDFENGVMLPAQMFRHARDLAMEMSPGFTYSLQSEWPINKQNAPKTSMEKEGLQFIGKNPGKNFYGEEKIGDQVFYTAVYPDVAVSPACIDCHNDHKDSPRDDFKMDEVMGGVVIRIPLK
ncbi:MAG: DUF3365 domain-containing protein [Lentisphaeraceae bacterium]|nr:DUF3365 domain-containing protein [Lentisphaeraceae bacterium]